MKTVLPNSLLSPTTRFSIDFLQVRRTSFTVRLLAILLITAITSVVTQAQGRLAGWDFSNTFSPTSASLATGITASSVSKGSGITNESVLLNFFSATHWASETTIDLTDYVEFTVTPGTNYTMLLTSVSITDVANAGGVGPKKLTLRASTNNFASDIIASPLDIGSINPFNPPLPSFTLAIATPIVSTSAVTFRLYGYNAFNPSVAASRLLRFDNLQVNGMVLSSVPTSLTGLNATCGSPSATQSFTLGGANLPNNVVISAPTGFEIAPNTGSCPASGYASTTTVAPSSLTGTGQVVCVRRQAGLTPGSVSSASILTITSGTSLSATIALSGSTSAAPSQPTIAYSGLTTCSGTLSFSACPVGQTATFSVTGGSGSTVNNVLTLTTSGSYTITAICVDNASSCSSVASSPVAATVNSTPNATFSGLISNYCFGAGPVTLTPAVGGGTFSLTGAGSLAGNVYTPPTPPGGAATITYSVTANGCSASSSQATVTGAAVPPITSLTASGSLSSGLCTVQLGGVATGTSFVFTGPGGYLYSNAYREFGTYSVSALEVKLPGTYTLTASTEGGCTSATYQVVVTGTPCNQ